MSICDKKKKKKKLYKFFVLLTKKTTFKLIVIFKIDLLFIAQITETIFSFYGLPSVLTVIFVFIFVALSTTFYSDVVVFFSF
jgi:hypothetical protein